MCPLTDGDIGTAYQAHPCYKVIELSVEDRQKHQPKVFQKWGTHRPMNNKLKSNCIITSENHVWGSLTPVCHKPLFFWI